MGKLREKLLSGQTALGVHSCYSEPFVSELYGLIGYDYVWIDTEHTHLDLSDVENHLMASRAGNISPIVRVPSSDPVRIKPILEMGPEAIVIPQVNSYEEVVDAVRYCSYPLQGVRGWGPRFAIRYGLTPTEEYIANVKKETMCFVQIENIHAVEDIDKSVTVDGVDAFIIGANDLASSAGYLGKSSDPAVCKLIDKAVERVHLAGKKIGVSLGAVTEQEVALWKKRGMDLISCACEADFILNGSREQLNLLKKYFR